MYPSPPSTGENTVTPIFKYDICNYCGYEIKTEEPMMIGKQTYHPLPLQCGEIVASRIEQLWQILVLPEDDWQEWLNHD